MKYIILVWSVIALNILATAKDIHAVPLTDMTYTETPDSFELKVRHGPIVFSNSDIEVSFPGLGRVKVDQHRLELGSFWTQKGFTTNPLPGIPSSGLALTLFPKGPLFPGDEIEIHSQIRHAGSFERTVHLHERIRAVDLQEGTKTFVSQERPNCQRNNPARTCWYTTRHINTSSILGIRPGSDRTVIPSRLSTDQVAYSWSVTKQNNEITDFIFGLTGKHEENTPSDHLSAARLNIDSGGSSIPNSSFFTIEDVADVVTAAVAPEPSNLMLLGSGIPGILLLGKRLAALRG